MIPAPVGRDTLRRGAGAALLGLSVLVGCSQPAKTPPAAAVAGPADPAAGRAMFWAGGCASCHATPGPEAGGAPRLGGGRELVTRYGTFRAPNISPDEATGIGGWTEQDFANAMLRGVSPRGGHYYPAFPYTSYGRMTGRDVKSLWAYLQTLPPVANEVAGHDLRFPVANRRAAGLWKNLFFRPAQVVRIADRSAELARGQYLVEGPGHCGECHTPRNALGGLDYDRWLAGGAMPDGSGRAPNITPGAPAIGGQTIDGITRTLEPALSHGQSGGSGFAMEAVRRNLAELSPGDRRAIAAYLKAVPAVAAPD